MTTENKARIENLYVFDLDGTLADLKHRIHYIKGQVKDWDTFSQECDKDIVIEWVKKTMQ